MATADAVRSLTITPEVLSLIAEVDEFKGAWRALSMLAPERLAVLRKVATIESIGSSTRIEGARLSDREVEALLSRIERIRSTHTTRKKLPVMPRQWNESF
jgi:Fic family protein